MVKRFIDESIALTLIRSGYTSLDKIKTATTKELSQLQDISPTLARKIKTAIYESEIYDTNTSLDAKKSEEAEILEENLNDKDTEIDLAEEEPLVVRIKEEQKLFDEQITSVKTLEERLKEINPEDKELLRKYGQLFKAGKLTKMDKLKEYMTILENYKLEPGVEIPKEKIEIDRLKLKEIISEMGYIGALEDSLGSDVTSASDIDLKETLETKYSALMGRIQKNYPVVYSELKSLFDSMEEEANDVEKSEEEKNIKKEEESKKDPQTKLYEGKEKLLKPYFDTLDKAKNAEQAKGPIGRMILFLDREKKAAISEKVYNKLALKIKEHVQKAEEAGKIPVDVKDYELAAKEGGVGWMGRKEAVENFLRDVIYK